MRRKHKHNPRFRALLALSTVAVFCAAAFVFVGSASAVSFYDPGSTLGLTDTNLLDVVMRILQWVLGLMALVAVGFIIYGGIVWMTSQGNEEKIEKAKKIILNAVVGLVVVLLSWAIVFFVTGVLNNATNGSGGSGGPGNGPGDLPGQAFKVREITTSCRNGKNYNVDVARCTSIQIEFTHPVHIKDVKDFIASGDIWVEQCGSAGNGSSLPKTCAALKTPIWPVQVYDDDDVWPASYDLDDTVGIWLASGKTLAFYRPMNKELWPGGDPILDEEQYYRIHLPETLREQSENLRLTGCSPSTGPCIYNQEVGEFTWMFWVGELIDDTAPFVESSYPRIKYDNPDINVDRLAIIWALFNEPIQVQAFGNDLTIEIFECTDNVKECTTTEEVQDALYHDRISEKSGKGFELSFTEPLKGFQWYKIQVQNIRDLCENEMDPISNEWVFQTNNQIPGVANLYPYQWPVDVCPDTSVGVVFNTSMYDTVTQQCGVPDGHVKGDAKLFGNQRNLRVMNNYPGLSADPNAYCTNYEYLEQSDHLTQGTYTPILSTDLMYERPNKLLVVPDAFRDWEYTAWDFTVGEWGACQNPPVITGVLPDFGSTQQCVTVFGSGFDTGGAIGTENILKFNAIEALDYSAETWFNDHIVARVPPGLPHTSADVNLHVTYHTPLEFEADVSFADGYRISGDGEPGACLYNVNPDEQFKLGGVSLAGSNFGVTQGKAVFSENVESLTDNWTDTSATSTVPDTARVDKGLVKVRNTKGDSNPLDFYVIPPGSPWVLESAQCTLPGSPSPNPRPDDNAACPNAQYVSASFNMDMDEGTFTDSNIEVIKCVGGNCSDPQALTAKDIDNYNDGASGEGFRYYLKDPLEPSEKYQVTLSTNITSAEARPLPKEYVWQFSTRAENCEINAVSFHSGDKDKVIQSSGEVQYGADAYNTDSCIPLDTEDQRFKWTVNDPAIGTFQTVWTDEGSNVFEAVFPNPPKDTTVRPRVDIDPVGVNDTTNLTFDVVECSSNAEQCVQNDDACPPTLFCADDCFCKKGFDIDSRYPDQGDTIHKNVAVTVKFNQQVNISTFTPSSVQVFYEPDETGCPGGLEVPGTFRCVADQVTFQDRGSGLVVIDPHTSPYLVPGQYEVIIGPTIESLSGVSFDKTDTYTFSVTNTLAPLDRVKTFVHNGLDYYESTDDYFSCNGDSCADDRDPPPTGAAGNQHKYQSRLYMAGNHLINGAHAWNDTDDPGAVKVPNTECTDTDACDVVGTADGDIINSTEKISVKGEAGGVEKALDFPVTSDITSGGEGDPCSREIEACVPNDDLCNKGFQCSRDGACVCIPDGSAGAWCSDDPYPTCSENDDNCNPGLECNDSSCICEESAFEIVTRDPDGGEANICKNRAVTVEFNQAVDFASFAGNVEVTYIPEDAECEEVSAAPPGSWWESLVYRLKNVFSAEEAQAVVCDANVELRLLDADTIEIDPFPTSPYLSFADYTVTIGGSVKSLALGKELGSDDQYTFSTKDEFCEVDRVKTYISKDGLSWNEEISDLFTCQLDGCNDDDLLPDPGNQHLYSSTMHESSGHLLSGVHEWEDPTEFGAAKLVPDQSFDTCDGELRYCVVATADETTDPDASDRMVVTGTSGVPESSAQKIFEVKSSSCALPWPQPFPYRYIDNLHGDDSNQYFSMWYCRDGGLPPLLPEDPTSGNVSDQNFVPLIPGEDEMIREIFFPVESSLTPIVIRVMENEGHLDPARWFAKKFPGESTSLQPLTIDGFEAVRANNTVYVNAANYTGTGMYTNIYVLSLDLFAGADAVNIFNQLLDNIRFTDHTDMAGICVASPQTNKDCVVRDTWRYADQAEVVALLGAYHEANSQYPAVGGGENEPGGSGSFIKGITNNRWDRSWVSFGAALGSALPSDPKNVFDPLTLCDPPYEQETCWNADDQAYTCPAESTIYQFMTPDQGTTGELYSRFEYEGTHSWATDRGERVDPCSPAVYQHKSAACGCFNNTFLGDSNGTWVQKSNSEF